MSQLGKSFQDVVSPTLPQDQEDHQSDDDEDDSWYW